MTNYKTGRIYKIVCNLSDDVYIGSTFNRLSDRFRRHKYGFNQYLNNKSYEMSIYPLFKQYGVENFTIILIKEYLVCDKKHLLMYEQLWINKLNCVNKVIAFQLLKKQQQKQYFEKNKDRQRQYYHNNKIKINLQHKLWLEKNKEKINCVCGSNIIKSKVSNHLKTKKHLNFIKSSP
jgi:hypothetical protein